MEQELKTQALETLIAASRAKDEFKTQVVALADGGSPDGAIRFNPQCPPVKVLRLLMKLLEVYPEKKFTEVEVQAVSGCSNFTGKVIAQPGDLKIRFNWDCRWRAEQEGLRDAFGDPNQIRAAQQFGYQCFNQFEAEE